MNSSCPRCHHLQSDAEAAFCEECGAPLAGDSADVTLADISLAEPPTQVVPGAAVPPLGTGIDFEKLVQGIGISMNNIPHAMQSSRPVEMGDNRWHISPMARKMAGVVPTGFLKSCNDLTVEYCKELFFISGKSASIRFRVTPLHEDAETIDIWYSPQVSSENSPVYHVESDSPFHAGDPTVIEFAYTPDKGLSGVVPFRFYFGCHGRQKTSYYVMNVSHMVYAQEASGNQTFNISANQAGTINLGNIRFQESAEEKLEKLLRGAENYSVIPLSVTGWRPERIIGFREKVYSCDKLTLKVGEKRLQVLCLKDTHLGRKLDKNDIIVADLLNAASLKEFPNNSISREHAQIHYCGDAVNLFDLSSQGTFIDDVRATAQGMQIPQEAEVRFGPICWHMSMQRCELRPSDTICLNCAAHKIRSLVFTRKDRVPEAYLLVWQCCDLGGVCEGLKGSQILRRDGGFLLKMPSGELVSLVPGRKVCFSSGSVLEVEAYRQYGL